MSTATREELRHLIAQLLESDLDAARDALQGLLLDRDERLQAECDRRMLESGRLERVPTPQDMRMTRPHMPIRIGGKPVSETIIEERR